MQNEKCRADSGRQAQPMKNEEPPGGEPERKEGDADKQARHVERLSG